MLRKLLRLHIRKSSLSNPRIPCIIEKFRIAIGNHGEHYNRDEIR